MSAVELQSGGKSPARVDIHHPVADPESIGNNIPDHDEAVLARFGKRQQLRVSITLQSWTFQHMLIIFLKYREASGPSPPLA